MKRTTFILLVFTLVTSAFSQEITSINWWNPINSDVPIISSQAWSNEVQSIYHRLPARSEQAVRKPVWELSKHSAGLSIRFWTNAKNIQVRYKVKGAIEMPHMPATGVSGVDLYSKSEHGEWLRCWGNYMIDEESHYQFMMDKSSAKYAQYGREYQLFLPLYNEVENLEVGVEGTAFFNALPQRKERPIVAYGTSICQGACASRSGMAWTTILERNLERPVVNLGFSGNGRLEPALIDLMAEIDAKLYILDCLPNLNPEKDDVHQLTMAAVKKLRAKRPTIPIILSAHIGYANSSNNQKNRDKVLALNKGLIKAFHHLQAIGFSNIFLLEKEDIGLDFDAYVDYIHPNDLGMQQNAKAYEKLIRQILKEPIGQLSTTIPKTQSRDIPVYKWEERHQAMLELNKTNPPKICLFGNSITHFWGGAPKASIARGQDSWEKVMLPMGIRNFGFGWDRIENVIWRINHDELAGFEAERIVFMIGTNNLHLNNDDDILEGISALIKATNIRQSKAKILLIGLLPRREGEARIKQLNLKIAQLAYLEGVDYADIGQPFLLDTGNIDEALFTDGLHPNNQGYWLMTSAFQQLFQSKKNTQLENDRPSITEQKEAIKTMLIDMWDAIEKEDIERYASYIHPDFTQFGETDPILKIGKDTEVNGVKEWVKNSTAIHTEMEDPKITINGNVAWITYYWSDNGSTNGKAFASRGKSTRIFVKEGGKWLCIHGHYTLLGNNE